MTQPGPCEPPIDDATFRRGVIGMLASMERQISDIKALLPSDEQREFETKVFETSQNIEAIYKISTKILGVLRMIGLWMAGIIGGYIAAKQFVISEWEMISNLWRR